MRSGGLNLSMARYQKRRGPGNGRCRSCCTAAFVIFAAGTAGCGFIGGEVQCIAPEEVTSLRSFDPILVPDDLDSLDETKALEIPTATSPPAQEGKCLDEPPRYEESG